MTVAVMAEEMMKTRRRLEENGESEMLASLRPSFRSVVEGREVGKEGGRGREMGREGGREEETVGATLLIKPIIEHDLHQSPAGC